MATEASETDPGTTGDKPRKKGRLIYRQNAWTRVTHWVWAVSLFFLLLSGLQIFNAHPELYIGSESGFEYNNSVFSARARAVDGERRGITTILGQEFDTTGVLGLSGARNRDVRGFPSWATIPSNRDLATGRVVHLFFAWVLVGTLFVWFLASFLNRHAWRDLIPRARDITGLPRDIVQHLKFKFDHGGSYSPLQKWAYFGVLFILFPLIVLTGLTMSPGMDAAWPWLLDIFGGRQTARTIHFITMALLVLFFMVHMAMVILAGPINEMRSMITGWYRTSASNHEGESK